MATLLVPNQKHKKLSVDIKVSTKITCSLCIMYLEKKTTTYTYSVTILEYEIKPRKNQIEY